jgi:hypothetical protein
MSSDPAEFKERITRVCLSFTRRFRIRDHRHSREDEDAAMPKLLNDLSPAAGATKQRPAVRRGLLLKSKFFLRRDSDEMSAPIRNLEGVNDARCSRATA